MCWVKIGNSGINIKLNICFKTLYYDTSTLCPYAMPRILGGKTIIVHSHTKNLFDTMFRVNLMYRGINLTLYTVYARCFI